MRQVAILSLFAGSCVALAQPPAMPEPKPPTKAADGVIVEQIRDALETGTPAPAPGILGDVLEVIRQRGSILDGSVLDPKNEDPLNPDNSATHNAAADVAPLPIPPNPSTVVVAESLLRSARLLESIPGGDNDRAALIQQMRIQATRLLLQNFPL